MKRTFTFLLLSFIAISIALGQGRTLRGTVTSDQDGSPIPGVTVLVVGTTSGASTDNNGNFTIPFNGTSGKLQFSFIGMRTLVVDITKSNEYNVVLQQDVTALQDVVVTALGITRERKSLGYSQQDISGDALKRTSETNLINSMAGKVAGVYLQSSSGNVGASSRIIIRGNSSLRDANQPLFVVDGVPIDNSLVSNNSLSMYSTDFGNGASDINPSDIAEMSVLKGANASALYGSRGANGVILITTKSGARKGFSVSFETSTTFGKANLLTKFQNKYGQGGSMKYWYKDGLNGGYYDGTDESYGPLLDYTVKPEDIQPGGRLYWTVAAGFPQTPGQILQLPQFNSPVDPSTGQRIPTPWISHPNNVKDFFVTGVTEINNLALSKGGDWGNIRLSLTNSTQKGSVPNTDQMKNTISVSSVTKLTNKLSFEVKSSFMNIHSDNLAGSGYTFDNPMMQTIWTGRNVDWAWEKDHYQNPDGSEISWISRWHDNPYWMQNKMLHPSTKNRLIGNASLKYVFNDWLNLQVRAGDDFSHEMYQVQIPYGSMDLTEGRFEAYNFVKSEANADFLLAAKKAISSDFTISGSVGGNIMNNKQENQSTIVAKLVVPDVYSVSNAKEPPTTSFYRSEKEIQSLYAFFTAEYKSQFFLDVTGRNDWSSTLPKKNRSYFYPSATLSWVFTETLGLNKDIFSFGKLRFGLAQVGNDADPYQLSLTYGSQLPFGSYPSFTLNSTLPPLDLKSELITSKEIGTELKFFSNRLGLDATLYSSSSKNQILRANLSQASGFGSAFINAGQIDNKGVEITLSGTPVKINDFSWDISVNWSKNKNKVVALSGDIKSYTLYNIYGNIDVVAPVGGAYGTMMGTGYVYDAKGNIVVGDDGYPETSAVRALGNIMPDFMYGINNTFKYKSLSIGFLLDGRKGGNIWSRTNADGWATGALSYTVGPNQRGVEMRDPVAQGGGYCFGGVHEDGTPNTTYLEMEDARWNPFAVGQRWLYDASFLKLREVVFSYSLPTDFLSKLQIKDAVFSVFGRNLALLHSNVPNVDPEAATNNSSLSSQGGEYGSIPQSRSIGFSLKLTF